MRALIIALFVGSASTVLLLPSPVLAHIDPDPTQAQAGSRLSVGFTVEHGCDGSPTTSLDMRLPDGVTNAVPEAPDGWQGSIADNVVTFDGGSLPDDQQVTFHVTMTLPPTPDTTIYFPFVQRCEVGEIRWIDVPSDGSGDELNEPAPAMALTGPVATTTAPIATTVAPVTTTSPTTTAAAVTTAPPTVVVTTTTEAPADSVVATTPSATAATDENNGGDNRGLLAALGAGLAVVAVIAGAVIFVRRRPS